MVFLIHILFIMMLFLSSGALLLLIKTGGAVEEGAQINLFYSWFDILPSIWLYVSFSVLLVYFFINNKFKKNIFISSLLRQKLILLLFIWVILCSLLGEYIKDSLRFSMFIIVGFFLVLVEVKLFYRVAIRILITFIYFNLLLSLLFILFLPSYGVSVGAEHAGKWQGVFDHKNGLGAFCALSYTFLIWKLYCKEYKNFFGVVLAVILAIGSQSSTSLIIILVVSFLAIFHLLINKRIYRIRFYYVLSLLIISFIPIYFSANEFIFNIDFLNKDSSLSGRDVIWNYVINSAMDSPIYGYGTGAFGQKVYMSNGDLLFQELGFIVNSTHNGILETLYSFGYIGLFMIFFVLLKSINVQKNNDIFLLTNWYFTFFILLNISESRMLSFNLYTMILFFILLLGEKNEC